MRSAATKSSWRSTLDRCTTGNTSNSAAGTVRASNSLCDSAVTGLVWLPNWLSARYLRSGELVPVLSQIRLLPSEIHAVWPHSRYLPAKTRAAIDILLTQMPSQLPGS
ncbi:MAG: LysR-substrate domain-containing protein [Serratia liquefaciens]